MMRIIHLVWGYLGGGVDSVVDSYLAADLLHPGEVQSHLVIIRNARDRTAKLPDKGTSWQVVWNTRGRPGRLARRIGEIVRDRGADVVCLNGFNATIFGFWLARHLPPDIPVVSSFHGRYFPRPGLNQLKAILINRLELHFLKRRAGGVLAVSSHSRDLLSGLGVPVDKIGVVHNGIRRDAPGGSGALSRARGLPGGGCVEIISVSRLEPQKAPGDLLEAFAPLARAHPETRLTLVGDGSLMGALQARAKALGLSGRVRFTGNRHDVADLLARSDIFALASAQEDHSIAILEAMRAGLPVVVSDVGGNWESVRSGIDGLIVPPGRPPAMTRALERLVTSRMLRQQMGCAARARFEARFSLEVFCAAFLRQLLAFVHRSEPAKHG